MNFYNVLRLLASDRALNLKGYIKIRAGRSEKNLSDRAPVTPARRKRKVEKQQG